MNTVVPRGWHSTDAVSPALGPAVCSGPAVSSGVRPLHPHAGRCGERLATDFTLPTHTSDHAKVTNKVKEGRQVYATRSLDNVSFLDTNFFCFRIISLWIFFFFILLGNSKLFRMIIKFSEDHHTITNTLYNQLPKFLVLKE